MFEIEQEQDNKLLQIVKTSGLEQTKADFILQKFQDYFHIAADWEMKAKALVVTNPGQIAEMKMAREGRLFLKGKRVEIERSRKELKEQSLREGRAIDGIANVLKALIEPTEEYLERQERFVEIQEEERRKLLKEKREVEMRELGAVPELYDLEHMDEETYASIIQAAKDMIARQKEAERKAEEERIAKEKEQERIRVENERLRREAEEKGRQMAEERAKAEAEQKRLREEAEKREEEAREREAKLKAEQEAKLRAERERREREAAKAKAIADEKLRKEREERERLQAQLKSKAEAEAKEKKRLADEARKAERAPDKQKLIALGKRIVEIELPEVRSKEAAKIIQEVCPMLARINIFLRTKAEEL